VAASELGLKAMAGAASLTVIVYRVEADPPVLEAEMV
jgi:hypothetical protein